MLFCRHLQVECAISIAGLIHENGVQSHSPRRAILLLNSSTSSATLTAILQLFVWNRGQVIGAKLEGAGNLGK